MCHLRSTVNNQTRSRLYRVNLGFQKRWLMSNVPRCLATHRHNDLELVAVVTVHACHYFSQSYFCLSCTKTKECIKKETWMNKCFIIQYYLLRCKTNAVGVTGWNANCTVSSRGDLNPLNPSSRSLPASIPYN